MNKELNWWKGKEGDEYLDESYLFTEQEKLFERKHQISLAEVYEEFFGELDRDYRILEIGCNIGHKLRRLNMMGFKKLYGLEPNKKAYDYGIRHFNYDIIFINDDFLHWNTAEKFDIVMTNFVLQHISPEEQEFVMKKIARMTRKYVFALEFYDDSKEPVPVKWKGRDDITWKKDWVSAYSLGKSLEVVKRFNILRPDGFKDVAVLLHKKKSIQEL